MCCSTLALDATNPSSDSRTRRSSPWHSSSSCAEWRANAPSCETQKGSSRTCSPGWGGLHPSSLHRRDREVKGLLEPLGRGVRSEIVLGPHTLLVDSTLLSVLHPLLRFLRARASPQVRG